MKKMGRLIGNLYTVVLGAQATNSYPISHPTHPTSTLSSISITGNSYSIDSSQCRQWGGTVLIMN